MYNFISEAVFPQKRYLIEVIFKKRSCFPLNKIAYI